MLDWCAIILLELHKQIDTVIGAHHLAAICLSANANRKQQTNQSGKRISAHRKRINKQMDVWIFDIHGVDESINRSIILMRCNGASGHRHLQESFKNLSGIFQESQRAPENLEDS